LKRRGERREDTTYEESRHRFFVERKRKKKENGAFLTKGAKIRGGEGKGKKEKKGKGIFFSRPKKREQTICGKRGGRRISRQQGGGRVRRR